MSVTAMAGIVSFGPQGAKGQVATNWYRHRAVNVDLAVLDDVQVGVPEVGGIAVPTFPYKAGVMAAGGFSLQPRLESTLGWLLYGMMGKHTVSPVGDGSFDHAFEMAADSTAIPWMSFRKAIPRKDGLANTDLGEIYQDGKILSAMMQLPSDAPIGMRVDALACLFSEDLDPASWTYANTFEHWESIPVGCMTGGYLKIDGQSLPIVAAQVGWQNAPLDPRNERVFASPYLEDITIIQRRLTYDITVKWNNPDLYLQMLTGSSVGTQWTGVPHTASLELKTVSSNLMPSLLNPYSLKVEADEVMMTQVGGIVLAGNQAVMMRFQGTALEATNYAKFTLRNKVADYGWPAPSGS